MRGTYPRGTQGDMFRGRDTSSHLFACKDKCEDKYKCEEIKEQKKIK